MRSLMIASMRISHPELVLQQLAHRAHAAVAQVVDCRRRPAAIAALRC